MAIALTGPPQNRWEEYRQAESQGIRAEAIRTLEAFVDELLRLPEETWKPWALSLAARIVDTGETIPVRHPLFERVLFPALLEGLENKSPGCARWLAGLSQSLYRCPPCLERLGHTRASELALLRMAVAHDPTDRRSRQQLIKSIAHDLHHTLHELPAGVLYGMDGATPSQCDELAAELEDFRALIAAEGWMADYEPLVAECTLHFAAYKQYLLNRAAYGSYADFLTQRGGTPSGR